LHFAVMHSLGQIATLLNRDTVLLSGMQARFGLPVLPGEGYSPAYVEWFRRIIMLRSFNIAEDRLRDLWQQETKLLQLLHIDSTGSPTWALDSCGASQHPERRLLLSNHDLGVPLAAGEILGGLNFSNSLPELFAGAEMGENAAKVLRRCVRMKQQFLAEIRAEVPHLRTAVKWAVGLA
jgi:hypothetical protein